MKNTLLATVASFAIATAAMATDFPKKTTPAAPVAASAASVDSLSISYGQDFVLGEFGTKDKDTFGATYTHKFDGGLSAGAAISTSQSEGALLKQNIEAQAGYSVPVFAGLSVGGKIGVGQRFSTTNFPYYAMYSSADYKATDDITINAIGYRYRNAFDTTNDYESHQLSTGVTYALTKTYSVTAKIARNFDANFEETGDAATLAFNIKF